VLGLGDNRARLAAMPVMEGKAMLMESLVGLSACDPFNTRTRTRIIEIVTPSRLLAAIQLETSLPPCFRLEEEIQKISTYGLAR